MAIDTINIGTTANDGSGDPLRTAFTKINTMFTELYGTSGEGVAMKDDETPQLGGDLDVLGRRITSTRSNEDIVILPNGTGGVVASGIRLAGTQLSADDSSAITIAEALQINGATNIDGAVTATSTLTVTGATTVAAISASGAATFTGGVTAGAVTTNAITSNGSNADLSIQPSGTGDVILSALRVNGTTLDSSDSTKVTIAEAVDITGAVTAASTVGITGAATLSSTLAVTGVTTLTTTNIDNINIYDNYITSDSNADINITAGGTGNVIVGSLTVNGTAISSADSSLIQINEAVNISGATDIAGALTTIGQTITGNVSITGATTFVGAIGVGDLNILADGTITTDSNGDFVVDPAGTGSIVLTGPITATGTQTTTGQLNIDNLRFDGNTFSATSGGITLTPAAGQNVVVSGTNVNLVAGEANFTVCEATTLRTDALESDTSDGDLTIGTQGTGVVDFLTATQETVGGVGAASKLPMDSANEVRPTGYLNVKVGGSAYVIPYFNAS
jgi:hypothetical protein